MKKMTAWIIAGVCVALGLVIFGVGLLFNGRGRGNGGNSGSVTMAQVPGLPTLGSQTRTREQRSYAADAFDEIFIASGVDDLRVGVSPGGGIELTYWQSGQGCYTLRDEGGKLYLSMDGTLEWGGLGVNMGREEDRSVVLLLPADFSGKLDIAASTGDVEVAGVSVSGDMALGATTGSIKLSNASVGGALDLSGSTGDMSVSATSVQGSVTGSASTGEVELENVSVQGGVKLTVSTDGMDLENVTCVGALELEATTGSIELTHVSCAALSCITSTGDIELENVAPGGDVVLRATTGDITGWLVGSEADYTFTCRTSTGRCDLPENWGSGAKRFDAETSTGDILVRFGR